MKEKIKKFLIDNGFLPLSQWNSFCIKPAYSVRNYSDE